MDQNATPPVPHMLRPHHVGILLFLIVYYRGLDWGEKGQPPRPLQKKVKQRMLVVLAREIGEVRLCAPEPVLICSELGPNGHYSKDGTSDTIRTTGCQNGYRDG